MLMASKGDERARRNAKAAAPASADLAGPAARDNDNLVETEGVCRF